MLEKKAESISKTKCIEVKKIYQNIEYQDGNDKKKFKKTNQGKELISIQIFVLKSG